MHYIRQDLPLIVNRHFYDYQKYSSQFKRFCIKRERQIYLQTVKPNIVQKCHQRAMQVTQDEPLSDDVINLISYDIF